VERLRGPVTSILWLLPIIGGLIWCWSVGYEGLNGQDAHDYLRTARAWEGYFHGAERPLTAEHPQAYPYAGAVLGTVLGNVLIAMRLLPILAFIAVGLVFRRALEKGDQLASPASGVRVAGDRRIAVPAALRSGVHERSAGHGAGRAFVVGVGKGDRRSECPVVGAVFGGRHRSRAGPPGLCTHAGWFGAPDGLSDDTGSLVEDLSGHLRSAPRPWPCCPHCCNHRLG
jgi:hypothetical protein